jgi:threonine/homoserine/homoserine lactone efflux protein
MIDPLTLLAFVPAALALNLTPGADMMFTLAQGMKAGPRAALAASAGIAVGGMIHVTVAGLGLGALVAAHPWLFDAIRWIGVAYLLALAWRSLTMPATLGPLVPATRQAFRAALIVSLTNPKVILFVLAFVPQFIVPGAGPVLMQFLVLGAILSAGGLVVNGAVGLSAGRARGFLGSARVSRWLGRLSGGIFMLLAVRLALPEKA